MMKFKFIICYCFLVLIFFGISSFSTVSFLPTPFKLDIPGNFQEMHIPTDNPLTIEGVALGRKLFYEPLLSANNKMSCGTCHQQQYAFANNSAVSIGVDGLKGKRNALPIFNLGWTQGGFFWDGRSATLEAQVFEPMQNPIEMHESLENAVTELQAKSDYPRLFQKAFGSKKITAIFIANAISQFERTIISSNSRYDKVQRNEPGGYFTPEELSGLNLFIDQEKGNCSSCHTLNNLVTSFSFANTGLDSIAIDSGRYAFDPKYNTMSLFKTPSLRNIELTTPYMHDGRFQTLDQVLDHYNEGFKSSPTLNRLISENGKKNLSPIEKKNIIAFLKTLTDSTLITNPRYSNPNL